MQRLNSPFCHLIFWNNEFSGGKLRSEFNCQDHFGWKMTDICCGWQAVNWQVRFTPSHDGVWTTLCSIQSYSWWEAHCYWVPKPPHFHFYFVIQCKFLKHMKHRSYNEFLPIHIKDQWHTSRSDFYTVSQMSEIFTLVKSVSVNTSLFLSSTKVEVKHCEEKILQFSEHSLTRY